MLTNKVIMVFSAVVALWQQFCCYFWPDVAAGYGFIIILANEI